VPSNFTSISVASSGTICSDPNLFTAADIQNVANGNPMRLGTSLLSQFTVTGTEFPGTFNIALQIDYETGKSYYQQYTPALFLTSLTSLSDLAVSLGSCAVFQYVNGEFVDPVPAPGLAAGAAINVTGDGVTLKMANSVIGHYQGTFSNENPFSPSPPFLMPGATFAVNNGTGGTDVGAFTFNATLPAAITWTNKPTAATIPRNQNLTVTWSGGDPSSFVYVLGQSPLDANGDGAEFVCVAQNAAGGLTVPSAVLSALPVSANVLLTDMTIPGGLMVVNATTITRESATGLDVFLSGTTAGDGLFLFSFQ